MQVRDIEEWVGQEVVDCDGEKLGKLEEVFSAVGGSEPVAGVVKSGLLKSELHAVPLADATVGRGQIRLGVAKDVVKGSPTIADAGSMTRQEEVAFVRHYGVGDESVVDGHDPDEAHFESATTVRARHAAVEADLQRAADLEAEADQVGRDAEEAEQAAAATTARAGTARQHQSALLREAHDLRQAHGLAPAPPPDPS